MKKRNTSVRLNAVLNVIRQLCNTVLPLVTFSYATRVLQVENYGRINFSSSVVSYFILIAGLGIRTYAVREAPVIRDDPEKIRRFVSQMFSVSMATTFLAYLLLAVTLWLWQPGERYSPLILIYATSILLTTLSVEWFFLIYEEYLYITIRTIIVHVIQILLVFLFVKSPEDTALYTMIIVFTVGALQLVNFFIARKKVPFRLTADLDLDRHLRPILLLFANMVLVVIYSNSDITMLGVMRQDADVGIYKAAVNLYQSIKTLLNAVYVVTIPRLASCFQSGKDREFSILANQVVDTLVTLVLPALVGLCLISEHVILFISGESYLAATGPLRILSVSLLFGSVGGFFANAVLIVCKKERLVLRATILSGAANVLLNLVFIPLWGPVGAALTTLLAEAIVALLAIWYSRGIFKIQLKGRTIFSVAAGCAGILGVCLLVSSFGLNKMLEMAIILAGSLLFYGLVQLAFRPELRKMVSARLRSLR